MSKLKIHELKLVNMCISVDDTAVKSSAAKYGYENNDETQ